MNYRNAMAIMFSSIPDKWLGPGALVHFEQKYCISCYYDVRIRACPPKLANIWSDISCISNSQLISCQLRHVTCKQRTVSSRRLHPIL